MIFMIFIKSHDFQKVTFDDFQKSDFLIFNDFQKSVIFKITFKIIQFLVKFMFFKIMTFNENHKNHLFDFLIF